MLIFCTQSNFGLIVIKLFTYRNPFHFLFSLASSDWPKKEWFATHVGISLTLFLLSSFCYRRYHWTQLDMQCTMWLFLKCFFLSSFCNNGRYHFILSSFCKNGRYHWTQHDHSTAKEGHCGEKLMHKYISEKLTKKHFFMFFSDKSLIFQKEGRYAFCGGRGGGRDWLKVWQYQIWDKRGIDSRHKLKQYDGLYSKFGGNPRGLDGWWWEDRQYEITGKDIVFQKILI